MSATTTTRINLYNEIPKSMKGSTPIIIGGICKAEVVSEFNSFTDDIA
jgi:hypothetical protein